MPIQKPDLTRVWAGDAPSGNVIDPDDTTPGKFGNGWQAEVPPFEHFNFIQKLQTQGLAHINEQGIPVWDTDTVYPVNALVKGSDGNIYKAISEQSGNNPTTDNSVNWINWEATDRSVYLDSVAESISNAPLVDGSIYLVSGWYGDSRDGPSDALVYQYDASRSKSDHDGFNVVSPTVPPVSEQTDGRYDFHNGEGETDPGGTGCFVLKYSNRNQVQRGYSILGRDEVTDFVKTAGLVENAASPLDIPTYVSGNDELVHPSVIYIKDGFQGYPYWMVATPYANTDNQVENPSIWASFNGTDWVVPSGVTNPIHDTPAGSAFYSDTQIFYDETDNSLNILWRYSGSREYFLASKSFDSVNWSDPEIFYNFDYPDRRGLSPSVMYVDGKYWMYYVGLGDLDVGQPVYLTKADNIFGPWSDPVEVSTTTPSERDIWHLEVRPVGRRFLMLAQLDNSSGGDLAFGTSNPDGLEFNFPAGVQLTPVNAWEGTGLYKSTFIVSRDFNGEFVRLWYGSGGSGSLGWRVGYTSYYINGVLKEGSTAEIDQYRFEGNELYLQFRAQIEVDNDSFGEKVIDLTQLPGAFLTGDYSLQVTETSGTWIGYGERINSSSFRIGVRQFENITSTSTRVVYVEARGKWIP